MKTILFSIFSLLICSIGMTQRTAKIYLDEENNRTDSANAVYVKEVIYENGIYKITDTDMDQKMLYYGEYSSLKPPIENGLVAHYSEPDVLYAEGQYLNGQIIGDWYYYEKDELGDSVNYSETLHYSKDSDCTITEFANSSSKNKALEGKIAIALNKYINDNFHLPPRTLIKSEFFDLDMNFTVNTQGRISCIEIINSFDSDLDAEIIRILKQFKSNEKIKDPIHMSFTFSNEEDAFVIVEVMPEFQGGDLNKFRQYVARELIYPERAAKEKIQGRVFVQFCVDSRGQVCNVKIVRSVHPLLDAEAVRVIKNSPLWKPGTQRGKPVRVEFTFPVVFTL